MPQPPTASSSPEQPESVKPKAPAKPRASRTAKATGAKPAAAKKTTATAAAKPAAAKPAATRTARKPAAKAGSASAAKSASSKAGAAQRGGAEPTGKGKPRIEIHVNADAKQLEAIAERVRKLNERIIELGREAGEGRLASYEKTLKTIASGIAQGPGKDELEWITQLASSQAKFVREITDSWAKAARDRFR